jgi:fused-like protein
MKFILKHGKSDKDIHNLRQEIEVLTAGSVSDQLL